MRPIARNLIATRPRTAICCASTQVAAFGASPARIDDAADRIELARLPRTVFTLDRPGR
jgi:hypothetical protein